MIIEAIRVKNFRSIYNEELFCDNLTVLVGPNGSGKSTFLKALELFYNNSPTIEQADFYNNNINQEIVIAITFKELNEEAIKQFASYLQDNKLTVERVITWENGKPIAKYHGSKLQNPDFNEIRIAEKAADKKAIYEKLRTHSSYANLPRWTKQDDVLENMKEWEANNQNKCLRSRDEGQFFGFKEVASGYLGRYSRFLLIPAVREASEDALEGKGSVLTELMDLVVRSVLANKEELKKLKEETDQQYREILDPSKLNELSTLSQDLTKTLKTYVAGAQVNLIWQPLEKLNIPLPKADIELIEDGYSSAVERTGHGLQRAFILTMLQHLIAAKRIFESTAESEHSEKLPNLILSIEEPELYQHPNRQRHFAGILYNLAIGRTPGVAERTQIIHSTHSPLFIGLDRINELRLFKKESIDNKMPKITKVISANIDKVAKELWQACGKHNVEFTATSLLPRLQAIMTPWINEGFFANVVVLVEGENDRAAILGTANAMGYNFEAEGISVIPCNGKTCLDRPAIIFRHFGISTYIIWDSDKDGSDAKPETNHILLRIVESDVEDWPNRIEDKFACFEVKLETTIRKELGHVNFDKWLEEIQIELDIGRKKDAIKNPVVMTKIIQKAAANKTKSNSLEKIIKKIVMLAKE